MNDTYEYIFWSVVKIISSHQSFFCNFKLYIKIVGDLSPRLMASMLGDLDKIKSR